MMKKDLAQRVSDAPHSQVCPCCSQGLERINPMNFIFNQMKQ